MSENTSNRNESSGLPVRNPTHMTEADNADDQSDIVKAIRKTGVKRMVVTYDYSNIDKQNPPPLAGIIHVRDMTVQQAQKYCSNLLRSKPNIFKLHIKLGEYEGKKRISNAKTRLLDSSKARFHSELGEKFGDVIADKTMHVTEIIYRVNNNEPGRFDAAAEVYGVSEEEYLDDENFKPSISFEFIKVN
jgi:hypothetical protein